MFYHFGQKLGYFRENISISIAFLQLLSHLIFIIRIADTQPEPDSLGGIEIDARTPSS
jgi:hypothetical protein